MSMSGKVLPSTKVATPMSTGQPGELPQTTPRNPSQTNGMSPPAIPPGQRDLGEIAPFRPDTGRFP
jgi:hypothetical protein